MKVLLVHNAYRSALPSGENQAVSADMALLSDTPGLSLEVFTRSNDEAQTFPWVAGLEAVLLARDNPRSRLQLRSILRRFRPDIVHVHNTFPLLTPSIFDEIRASGTALVWSVHNFRPWCIRGDFRRDGQDCRLCANVGHGGPSVEHRCYRDSRLLSGMFRRSTDWHLAKRTWHTLPHRIVAVSEFLRTELIGLGLPAERLVVRGNVVTPAQPLSWENRSVDVAYVGRLSPEKGPQTLLAALELLSGRRKLNACFIGDGPLRETLVAQAQASALAVEFAGNMAHPAAMRRLASARVLVAASTCLETFGLTALEACARGVPVLASDCGGYRELLAPHCPDCLLPPGDPTALAIALDKLLNDETRCRALATQLPTDIASAYTPDALRAKLLNIYADARTAAMDPLF